MARYYLAILEADRDGFSKRRMGERSVTHQNRTAAADLSPSESRTLVSMGNAALTHPTLAWSILMVQWRLVCWSVPRLGVSRNDPVRSGGDGGVRKGTPPYAGGMANGAKLLTHVIDEFRRLSDI